MGGGGPVGVIHPASIVLEETPAGKREDDPDSTYIQRCDETEKRPDITKLEC